MPGWPSAHAPASSAFRSPNGRGKGVEAMTMVTPQQLAENPDKVLRMWQYADDAERRDLGEPDQRGEMTAAPEPRPDRGAAHARRPGPRGPPAAWAPCAPCAMIAQQRRTHAQADRRVGEPGVRYRLVRSGADRRGRCVLQGRRGRRMV